LQLYGETQTEELVSANSWHRTTNCKIRCVWMDLWSESQVQRSGVWHDFSDEVCI